MKSMISISVLMLCMTVTKSEVSPSLSPSASCSNIIYDMVDCVSFLSNDSSQEKPSPACCSGFQMVLDISVECICEALKSSADLGVDVNLTKAAMLPSACKVSAPPVSACNLTANPSVQGSSNTPSPSAPADDVAKHAPSPSPSGSSCLFALLSMPVITFSYISH